MGHKECSSAIEQVIVDVAEQGQAEKRMNASSREQSHRCRLQRAVSMADTLQTIVLPGISAAGQ